MVGHAIARQGALRADARHEYQVEHPCKDLIVLENTGQSNAVWPREYLLHVEAAPKIRERIML
jgi:hypothetical protein